MKIFSWVACAAFAAPLWGAIPAHPGMLNYMEGQASINGEPVNSRSVGSMDVERGQVLQTGQGKAEILLTPGVFLRLGDNSALRMVSPALTNTSVELLHGEALVEVADLHKENNLRVLDGGAIRRSWRKTACIPTFPAMVFFIARLVTDSTRRGGRMPLRRLCIATARISAIGDTFSHVRRACGRRTFRWRTWTLNRGS